MARRNRYNRKRRQGRFSFLYKILVFAAICGAIAVALALLSVRGQLQTAQEQLDEVTRQVRAQTEINAGLAEDIANSGDAGRIEDIAREKLDLVEPDERVFVDANH